MQDERIININNLFTEVGSIIKKYDAIAHERSENMNMSEIMKELARKREVFHMEADFQFSLAWQIKENFKDSVDIRMEYPIEAVVDETELKFFQRGRGRPRIDILVQTKGKKIPIELKYLPKTTKVGEGIISSTDECFHLRNSTGVSWGRFGFLGDVSRVERIVTLCEDIDEGYAIILTNDKAYEKDPQVGKTCEGLGLTGTIGGKFYERINNKSDKETSGRLEIKKTYHAVWENYGEYNLGFRYLLIKV